MQFSITDSEKQLLKSLNNTIQTFQNEIAMRQNSIQALKVQMDVVIASIMKSAGAEPPRE